MLMTPETASKARIASEDDTTSVAAPRGMFRMVSFFMDVCNLLC